MAKTDIKQKLVLIWNCLSYLFMCGVSRILRRGYNHHLNEEDLDPLHSNDDARLVIDDLQEKWDQELRTARITGQEPRLWKALMKTCSLSVIAKLLYLRFLNSFYTMMLVVMLYLYLDALQTGPARDLTYTKLCLVGLCASTFFKLFTLHHEHLISSLTEMRLKNAVTGIVYKHVLESSRYNLSRQTEGFVVNLVSNDAKRVEKLLANLINFARVLYETLFAVPIIVLFVGWQGLACFILFVLMIILFRFLAEVYSRYRKEQFKFTDKRLTAMSEIISGIRVLKMNSWEHMYRDRVKLLRSQEIGQQRNALLVQSNVTAFSTIVPLLATLISVSLLILTGVTVTPKLIFPLTTIINILSVTIGKGLPLTMYSIKDAKTALDRVQGFLVATYAVKSPKTSARVTTPAVQTQTEPFKEQLKKKASSDTKRLGNIYVEVKELCASWNGGDPVTLSDVSLSAHSSQLVMVTGAVGCGKTSLLMAILREIPIKHGSVDVRGKTAFVSETPWVFSDTFRENILFGKTYIKKKYDHVIELCDLVDDIRRLPKGDLSMIGQRGVTLSRGQRSRVSLARAVYSDADIFLLDDPLSAVDAHVGQHIFDKCICGELGSKLRILATHQAQQLAHADHVMILEKGRVKTQGGYDEIKESSALKEMMDEAKRTRSEAGSGAEQDAVETKGKIRETTGHKDVEEEAEDRVLGTVTWKLYWQYLRASLSSPVICLIIVFWFIAEAARVTPYWWLSMMSRMTRDQQRSGVTLGVYCGLICTAFLFVFIRADIFILSTTRASLKLHDRMTEAVIKCPVSFFDMNPEGRIMNRFSKDTGSMDGLLPAGLYIACVIISQFLGTLVLTAVVNLWFVVGIVPILLVFWLHVRFYLRTARDLQRLESIKSSPVIAHVSDTMAGLESVHSFQMEGSFMDAHIRNQNEHTRAFKLVLTTGRWANLYTDLIASFFVAVVAVGSQLLNQDPGVSGLLLTCAIQCLDSTQYGVRMATEVECLMTSVERIISYTKLPSEPGYHRRTLPPEDWPDRGALSVQDMSLVYHEGGARVLEGISLEVQPKEKVGIVGRTGAGKSSLVAALFRMPEPKGRVLIDGVDLGTLDIQSARKAMAVITQEPVLFSGTLKRNLDPMQQFTNQEVWTALENVQMMKCVKRLPGKLEYRLGESGSGFSVGERQLLCLARALLQKSKLLVLDEATANVDYRTDRLVQQVIRDKFADVTVLTIAHRVNTIMDYDKVVVIDTGRVVEYGEPEILARKSDGFFAHLVRSHDKKMMSGL